jgi:hypothetical protein
VNEAKLIYGCHLVGIQIPVRYNAFCPSFVFWFYRLLNVRDGKQVFDFPLTQGSLLPQSHLQAPD